MYSPRTYSALCLIVSLPTEGGTDMSAMLGVVYQVTRVEERPNIKVWCLNHLQLTSQEPRIRGHLRTFDGTQPQRKYRFLQRLQRGGGLHSAASSWALGDAAHNHGHVAGKLRGRHRKILRGPSRSLGLSNLGL